MSEQTWTCTRAQLTDALANIEVHPVLLSGRAAVNAESMADAILAQLPVAAMAARDEIIRKLAAAFGPHKAYDSASRSYLPDGNDAEGSCSVSFIAGDGCTSARTLTYGEIADALAQAGMTP